MARLFWVGARRRRRCLRRAQGRQGRRRPTRPTGVADGLSDFGDGLRELAAAVREGMAEREGELRLALGIDAGTADDPEASAARLDAASARALLDDPTGRRASSVGACAHPRACPGTRSPLPVRFVMPAHPSRACAKD